MRAKTAKTTKTKGKREKILITRDQQRDKKIFCNNIEFSMSEYVHS